MQDARVRGALIAICLACLLGSGYVLLKGHQSSEPPVVFATPAAVAASTAGVPAVRVKRTARIFVDVAGAVRRPSLYLLPSKSRVMQAVMAAGGPTAVADLDALNLAQPVTDGEKVFVPKRGMIISTAAVNPQIVRPAPMPLPSQAGAPKAPVLIPTAASAKAGKGSSGSRSNKISAESGEQIGLNTATAEELERLPGVGPSMAARILGYRQQAGSFSKIEDLTLVTGIGPKKFAKIAPFVTLN